MLRLFAAHEVAGVTVTCGAVSTVTDAEGYFTLKLPRTADHSGWVDVAVVANNASAICQVLVPRADAQFMAISDIDDTMIQTGTYSLWRNLWTSLTGNARTRHIFPDAVELMQVLHQDGRNPVYFVSSSPWNFHGFLRDVFQRAGLPQAPMFLLGDTGQHDADVYAQAVVRHPGRVAQVILRAAGTVDREDAQDVARLRGLGVAVQVALDYRDATAQMAATVSQVKNSDRP